MFLDDQSFFFPTDFRPQATHYRRRIRYIAHVYTTRSPSQAISVALAYCFQTSHALTAIAVTSPQYFLTPLTGTLLLRQHVLN